MKPHILKTRRGSRAVAKTAKLRRPVAKRSRRKAERPPIPVAAAAPAADQKRPTGKLGRVLNAVAATRGASLDELVELTGWQPHTARATAAPLVVTVPLLRRRTGRDTRLLMDGPEATQPDPSLVRMLVRARTCKAKLLQSGEARLTETS